MSFEYFINNLIPITFLLIAGGIIRQSLVFASQLWAKTFHHTLSFFLLPVATFVITKAISGNIALSLGMIGALSIVRFRNPVKNPFELVIFFCSITMGIAAGVDIKLAILLLIVVTTVIVFSQLYSKFRKKNNKTVFLPSFEEGYSLNIIEVSSEKEINDLKKFNLIYFNYYKKKSIYEYKISERDKNEILRVEKIIDDCVLNYEIRYSFD